MRDRQYSVLVKEEWAGFLRYVFYEDRETIDVFCHVSLAVTCEQVVGEFAANRQLQASVMSALIADARKQICALQEANLESGRRTGGSPS